MAMVMDIIMVMVTDMAMDIATSMPMVKENLTKNNVNYICNL